MLLVLLVLFACSPTESLSPTSTCDHLVTSSAGMRYCGGHVFQSGTHVVAVYWSTDTIYRHGPTPGTSGTEDSSLIGYFLTHLAPSPWYNIVTTYSGPDGRPIANRLSYDGYVAANARSPRLVTEDDIVAMLGREIPHPDANTVYVVFTPEGVLPPGFPNRACGFHNVSDRFYYAVIPYAFNTDCAAATIVTSANDDPAADAILTTLAHEVVETATDPVPGWGWHDMSGAENADKCSRAYGPDFHITANGGWANMTLGAKAFLIQGNWINVGAGRCATHFP